MLRLKLLAASAAGVYLVSVCVAQGSNLLVNQIQVIGTHNSYHAGLAPGEGALLKQSSAKAFDALNYRHQPLTRQLDGGVRQLELDVFADPQGGLYAKYGSPDQVKALGLQPDPPYDPAGEMLKPGFKVMHVQAVDQRSTCALFTTCLREIRTWSQANPQHVPIFILVETKQGSIPQLPQAPAAPLFTPALFDALDAEIRSVFPPEEIITPDQVRGSAATLPEAIAHDGWPTLESSRGKVIFLLDQRSNEPIYTEGHPALAGRVLFTNARPGEPDAAFTEQNEGSKAEINALVKQGYLVRTRTDADTRQARANDTSRRDLSLASGAQMLSTDYPATEPYANGYVVALPSRLKARCNPVNAPKSCVDAQVEP